MKEQICEKKLFSMEEREMWLEKSTHQDTPGKRQDYCLI